MNKKIFLFLLMSLAAAPIANAYVANSTNYRLETDSINIGGTEDSVSSNYKVRDTVGEVGTGVSSSASYNISAGYRTMVDVAISVSSPSDVTLSPSISGISGGTGTGSASWTVITDAPGGYTLAVKASTDPALKSSDDSFVDYIPAGSDPDYAWSVADNASEFGFSPSGTDITSEYKDNGTICGTGSNDTTDACWRGFSTTNETVAQSSSGNSPSGTATVVNIKAEVGDNKIQTAGTYTATLTATATAN